MCTSVWLRDMGIHPGFILQRFLTGDLVWKYDGLRRNNLMMNLMVVDDEHSAVESIASSIAWREYGIGQVYKAYSVKEALQQMAAHQVHIIITDIRMPGLSGLDLVSHIRQKWEQTKCIILSGHASF